MHPLDIIYVVSLLLGGSYMLVSLLMGGLSHAAGHISHLGGHLHVPHVSDVGGHHHAGHAVDGAHGHAQHGHAGNAHHGHHAHHHGDDGGGDSGDSEDASGKANLLAYFNPTLLSGFLFGFGVAGLASRMMGVTPNPSAAYAGVGGMALWGSAFLLVSRMFGKAQGSSHNLRENLIGTRAQVTAPIRGSQPGMVAYTVGGTRQSLRAITEDEEPIPTGSSVRIRRIEGHTAHVVRLD